MPGGRCATLWTRARQSASVTRAVRPRILVPPNGRAAVQRFSVPANTNGDTRIPHNHPHMTTRLTDHRMTAAALRKLERLLSLDVEQRPRPVTGAASSPALCPSSTDEREVARVTLSDGATRPAGRCVERRCGYWVGGCSLGASVATVGVRMRELGAVAPIACGISAQCRWIAENGPSACVLCPHLRRVGVLELISDAEEAAQ